MPDPWMKFFTSDWRSEPTLKLVSRAARSFWVDILCLIHEGGDGRLHVKGKNPTIEELARLFGDNPRTVRKLMNELEEAGVFSRDEQEFVISRRKIRDLKKSERDRENGRKGGNPSLKNKELQISGVNPQDKAHIPEARIQNLEKKKKYQKEKGWFVDRVWNVRPRRINDSGRLMDNNLQAAKTQAEKLDDELREGLCLAAELERDAVANGELDQRFQKDTHRWIRDLEFLQTPGLERDDGVSQEDGSDAEPGGTSDPEGGHGGDLLANGGGMAVGGGGVHALEPDGQRDRSERAAILARIPHHDRLH